MKSTTWHGTLAPSCEILLMSMPLWKPELWSVIQWHTLIQLYVKPNTNAIWQEIDLEDLASNAGKKTAAREIMLSKLGNNQCKHISNSICSKHDKNFWATIRPFFSDKRLRNGHNISLRQNDNVETDPSNLSELFHDYFSRVAMDIGFDDRITSTSDAVDKHNSHPSFMKIRQQYGNESTFRFNLVDENCVALIPCNILTPAKPQGMAISRAK